MGPMTVQQAEQAVYLATLAQEASAKELAAAAGDITEAAARTARARAGLEVAAVAFDAAPDDAEKGRTAIAARDALSLAELREEQARKRHENVRRMHAPTERAVEQAARELEAARLEARKQELHEKASPGAFNIAAAPHVAAFVAAERVMRAAAEGLDKALAESRAARAEFLQLGGSATELGGHHLVLGILAEKIAAGDVDVPRLAHGDQQRQASNDSLASLVYRLEGSIVGRLWHDARHVLFKGRTQAAGEAGARMLMTHAAGTEGLAAVDAMHAAAEPPPEPYVRPDNMTLIPARP